MTGIRAVRRERRSICSFDRIARVYRLLEYASFGRLLERTRENYLPELGSARHALVLGDGDGRFLAALLASNRELRAVAVDSSRAMLDLLTRRCGTFGDRLTTRQGDLCADSDGLLATDRDHPFDLVVTHFFLDCLTDGQMEALALSVGPRLSAKARWVVSEFRTPPAGWLRAVGRGLIRSLYLGFRVLTGLRVRRLPNYTAALARAGFVLDRRRLRLGGLLVADMWHRG